MQDNHNLPLLPLSLFTRDAPVVMDVVYAQPHHPDNHFPGLYHPAAQIFAHLRLLPIILFAARLLYQRQGWRLQVKDCFRPVEAQAKMAAYGFPPELVMPPGQGGHPRGMAVDVQPIDHEEKLIFMGTPFDYFADDLSQNSAARHWQDFGAESARVISHRQALDAALFDAARLCGEALIGYPEEWWDYRLPPPIYDQYPVYREADLPPAYRLTTAPAEPDQNLMAIWAEQRQAILNRLHDLAAFT